MPDFQEPFGDDISVHVFRIVVLAAEDHGAIEGNGAAPAAKTPMSRVGLNAAVMDQAATT